MATSAAESNLQCCSDGDNDEDPPYDDGDDDDDVGLAMMTAFSNRYVRK